MIIPAPPDPGQTFGDCGTHGSIETIPICDYFIELSLHCHKSIPTGLGLLNNGAIGIEPGCGSHHLWQLPIQGYACCFCLPR